MAHVHWWLVALAFVLGLVLTLTLMVRPVRTAVPAAAVAAGRLEPNVKARPTQKAAGARMATRQGPAKGAPRKGAPAKRTPAGKGAPTKKGPPRKGSPAKKTAGTKAGAAKRLPAGKGPAAKKTAATKESADSATKGMRVVKVAPTAKDGEKPFAPYGPGSARAAADGGGPEGWLVKGRSDTRLFYKPEDPSYDDITAQVWFQDEVTAARAFFTPWSKSTRKK